MKRSTQWVLLALAAFLALGIGTYAGYRQVVAGKKAVDALYALTLPDLEMHNQALSQWKNKTLLINYWATWCAPCREEIPALIRIQTRSSAKNVQIVGIALDSPDQVRAFAKSLGINYPVFIANMGTLDLMHAQGDDMGALPFTIVLSPGGGSAQTHLGALTEAQMESLIAEAGKNSGS
jgi:thiol-disulfide isomerase/thioredoxin